MLRRGEKNHETESSRGPGDAGAGTHRDRLPGAARARSRAGLRARRAEESHRVFQPGKKRALSGGHGRERVGQRDDRRRTTHRHYRPCGAAHSGRRGRRRALHPCGRSLFHALTGRDRPEPSGNRRGDAPRAHRRASGYVGLRYGVHRISCVGHPRAAGHLHFPFCP